MHVCGGAVRLTAELSVVNQCATRSAVGIVRIGAGLRWWLWARSVSVGVVPATNANSQNWRGLSFWSSLLDAFALVKGLASARDPCPRAWRRQAVIGTRPP